MHLVNKSHTLSSVLVYMRLCSNSVLVFGFLCVYSDPSAWSRPNSHEPSQPFPHSRTCTALLRLLTIW